MRDIESAYYGYMMLRDLNWLVQNPVIHCNHRDCSNTYNKINHISCRAYYNMKKNWGV